MTGTVDPTTAWALVVALGLGTFCLRLCFILLAGRVEEFPQPVERALRFVPVAVLAALVAPALLSVTVAPPGAALSARTLAGAVGAVVAWRTESMTATIAVGMAVLWGASLLG